MTGQTVAAERAGSSVYDLGYQRYQGPRLGRRHAIRALLVHSFKSSLGIGRAGRAKMPTIILGIMAIVPAIAGVAILALARQMGPGGEGLLDSSPIRHGTYYGLVSALVGLFVAIQAPELVGRDLRHRIHALYFSRALVRDDYALTRLAGMGLAVVGFVLIPQAVIFFGLVLSAPDPVAELGAELGMLPPVLLQAAIIGGVLAALATLISSYATRRAYATVSIIAVLVATPVLADRLVAGARDALGWVVLLSPADVLEGSNAFLFGEPSESDAVRLSRLPPEAYPVAAAVMVGVLTLLLVRRIRRLEA